MKKTKTFEIFTACVDAISQGVLINQVSRTDKEFHFQNWFEDRLRDSGVLFDRSGRNSYPDFTLVEFTEGYEIKGLAWPGRESTYGSYGDIMIRDRKMYVAPTPFAIADGLTGARTLLVPSLWKAPKRFKKVGEISRVEARYLVVGYEFDLGTNRISAKTIANPSAGKEHHFDAYQVVSDSDKAVTLAYGPPNLDSEDEEE